MDQSVGFVERAVADTKKAAKYQQEARRVSWEIMRRTTIVLYNKLHFHLRVYFVLNVDYHCWDSQIVFFLQHFFLLFHLLFFFMHWCPLFLPPNFNLISVCLFSSPSKSLLPNHPFPLLSSTIIILLSCCHWLPTYTFVEENDDHAVLLNSGGHRWFSGV